MGVSILFGLNYIGYKCVERELRELLRTEYKIAIIPWALAPHDEERHTTEDYFPVFERRYEREVNYLREFGIRDENVTVLDFYTQSKEEICDLILSADAVILCGGDTELLVRRLKETGADKALAEYDGIIIGGSAGATSQFERYFITAEQSYYGVLQECDGIGILKADFLIDVHTNQYTTERSEEERTRYLEELRALSRKYGRKVYGICDDGAMIFDRIENSYKKYGNVLVIGK